MASSTLKTQFSPYIAQLGMPSKGMLSAFGDAVDEYELDKRKDILFGIQEKQENAILDKTNFDLEQARLRAPFENEGKELDVKNKRFEVNELNPLKKTTEQNKADKTGIELQNEQWLLDHDANQIKLDTMKNQQKVANVNAKYAEQEKELEIGAKSNTQKLSALKLEDASSDDIIKKTASFFYTDSNGDGIIDEKDFAAVQKELKDNPNIPPEKLNEAYMYAKERVTKINEVESRIEKNTNVNLGVKSENLGKAKDKLAEQFNGMEQLKNFMINGYTDKQVGPLDSAGQALQEFIPILNSDTSAYYASQREALKGALAKAVGGNAPSNYEQAMAGKIIGGTWNSESGAAANYRSALDRGIISITETINRLSQSNIDTSEYKQRLKEYIAFRQSLNDWDGSTDINTYLKNPSKTKEPTEGNGTKAAPKFSTRKDGNTTTPIDVNNNKYF